MSRLVGAGALGALLVVSACTHELEVVNLDQYETAVTLKPAEGEPDVAVLPYAGRAEGLFYFNTIVERINANPGVGRVETDYIASGASAFRPDLIISILPTVDYDASGWNFLINWPGFLIFTPAWNGYAYYADITTEVVIHDGHGNQLTSDTIETNYSLRHAEMDRTIWAGLGWFTWTVTAFGGGIYNAFAYDDDATSLFHSAVKDNYGRYVSNRVGPKLRAAMQARGAY